MRRASLGALPGAEVWSAPLMGVKHLCPPCYQWGSNRWTNTCELRVFRKWYYFPSRGRYDQSSASESAPRTTTWSDAVRRPRSTGSGEHNGGTTSGHPAREPGGDPPDGPGIARRRPPIIAPRDALGPEGCPHPATATSATGRSGAGVRPTPPPEPAAAPTTVDSTAVARGRATRARRDRRHPDASRSRSPNSPTPAAEQPKSDTSPGVRTGGAEAGGASHAAIGSTRFTLMAHLVVEFLGALPATVARSRVEGQAPWLLLAAHKRMRPLPATSALARPPPEVVDVGHVRSSGLPVAPPARAAGCGTPAEQLDSTPKAFDGKDFSDERRAARPETASAPRAEPVPRGHRHGARPRVRCGRCAACLAHGLGPTLVVGVPRRSTGGRDRAGRRAALLARRVNEFGPLPWTAALAAVRRPAVERP